MKTNIEIITIDDVETVTKLIGTFEYHDLPRIDPLDEPYVAKVYQTLSGSYVTVYEDGVMKKSCVYDLDECKKCAKPHGGKRFRKRMRAMRTIHNNILLENNLPF